MTVDMAIASDTFGRPLDTGISYFRLVLSAFIVFFDANLTNSPYAEPLHAPHTEVVPDFRTLLYGGFRADESGLRGWRGEGRFSWNFKAKVAVAAIRGDGTVGELSARYQLHLTMIGKWKRRALEGLKTTFERGGAQACFR